MRVRAFGAKHGIYTLYAYWAQHEETFLKTLARETEQEWGLRTECGVSEMTDMLADIGRSIRALELKENILVENMLKKWVLQHPGAYYRPYGTRTPHSHRVAIRKWKLKVGWLQKTRRQRAEQTQFMKNWKETYGHSAMYSPNRQRAAKKEARDIRMATFGRIAL
jgi:hypothetical protein